MKEKAILAGLNENQGAATPLPPSITAPPPGFIDFPELSRNLPLCERSLREAIRRGQIPSIKLPGSRRVMFHWASVQEALLRLQRGAQ